MVAEPWIYKISKKKKKKKEAANSESSTTLSNKTIGILSFEVASAMSRAIHLHRSLADPEISRLRSQTLASTAVLTLVSTDDHHLLALALAEKLDDLNRIAATASRLGPKCTHPALLGFEHVYADLLADRIPDPAALGFLTKDIHSAIRRMERLVASTASLYSELETLTDLEHSVKKLAGAEETRRVLDQKIQWQRHDIKVLRDSSLWNQSYDKMVLLLARAVCTIHMRIRSVFGEAVIGLDSLVPEQSHQQLSGSVCRHIPLHSGLIRSDASEMSGPIKPVDVEVESVRNLHRSSLRLHCGGTPGRYLMDCLSLGSSASFQDRFEDESCISRAATSLILPFSGKIGTPRFGPKSRLMSLAPPSTIGGSALALHYANVIIIIEKLLRYPHLVGEEARDDLYQMMPSSLRSALRRSLKSYAKNMAIYDAPLAHDWKEAMDKILSWLAPMAHNMIRWQTERNFEQQQIVLRANVLLLETLYFADRGKTEEAICELLVGLNYICRYEQQQNALMDCTSSVDFDDCVDWQIQY